MDATNLLKKFAEKQHIGGVLVLCALLFSGCTGSPSANRNDNPSTASTETGSVVTNPQIQESEPKPSVDPERIKLIAFTDDCLDRTRNAYGFDSPVPEIIGAWVSQGYSREEIDELSLVDITESAGVGLGQGKTEQEVLTEAAKSIEFMSNAIRGVYGSYESAPSDSSLIVANWVVAIAKETFVPKQHQNAIKECGDLVGNTSTTTSNQATASSANPATTEAQATSSTPIHQYATLQASDPKAQINIREQPTTASQSHSYGVVGDRVKILNSTTNMAGEKWFEVYFEQSDTKGWIRSDFVLVDGI